MNSAVKQHFSEAATLLNQFLAEEKNFEAIESIGAVMVESLRSGGKIISCGNGGSLCDAMHFAEELSGRFRENRKSLAAISISDPSHITCVGNDYGFRYVFSRFVEGVGNKEDVLLAISTSGKSENVIEAALAAKNKGMKVVGLSGKDGGALANICDLEIRVPWNGYADRIQEIHIKVIHSLIDFIETSFKNDVT